MNREREPVRVRGWTALLLGLALQAVALWALDAPAKAIVGALAVTAVTSIGGLEFVRDKVTPVARPRADDGTYLTPVSRFRRL